jgi:hypothetical protein
MVKQGTKSKNEVIKNATLEELEAGVDTVSGKLSVSYASHIKKWNSFCGILTQF